MDILRLGIGTSFALASEVLLLSELSSVNQAGRICTRYAPNLLFNSSEIGHFGLETMAILDRNPRPFSAGNHGHFRPEYTPIIHQGFS